MSNSEKFKIMLDKADTNQNKIYTAFKKDLFKAVIPKKVITSDGVPSNTQTFISYFVNKIKDLYT